MVIGVVVVSFVKPMAFSRYFVVLLPALVPVLAVQIGALELIASAAAVLCWCCCWPAGGVRG